MIQANVLWGKENNDEMTLSYLNDLSNNIGTKQTTS